MRVLVWYVFVKYSKLIGMHFLCFWVEMDVVVWLDWLTVEGKSEMKGRCKYHTMWGDIVSLNQWEIGNNQNMCLFHCEKEEGENVNLIALNKDKQVTHASSTIN